MGRKKKVEAEQSAANEGDAGGALPSVEATKETEPQAKVSGVTVTFTGDPRGGKDPETPVYGGKSFPKGTAVEVDADWLKANANIRKNNHFKVE